MKIKVKLAVRVKQMRKRPPNELVPCPMCADRPVGGAFCLRCGGRGTVPKYGGPVIETVKRTYRVMPPEDPRNLLAVLGFARTGTPTAELRDGDLLRLAREWAATDPRDYDARVRLEGVIAGAGWFRPPPPSAECSARWRERALRESMSSRPRIKVRRIV